MRRMLAVARRTSLLFVLLSCVALSVGGQTPSAVMYNTRHAYVGDRVRFWLPGGANPTIALLISITADSVGYRRDCEECQVITKSRDDLARLEVSWGKIPSGGRTAGGFAVGAIIGLVGGIIAVANPGSACEEFCGFNILLIPPAVAVGGAIGALIGWSLKDDRWIPAVLAR